VSQIVRVKFLYRAALDQQESGHAFAAGMTISLLQDAVEAMAHDAAASVGAKVPARANFLDYWDAVTTSGSAKTLQSRSEMAALNAARVAFKHHGVEPAPSEAEKHVLAAHRFLQETARTFFDIDFDGLSEADLISEEPIRVAVKAAEDALARCDAKVALERCRDALDVFDSLHKATIPVAEKDPFGPRIPRELQPYADGIVRWVVRKFAALEVALSVSVLGVNPAEIWFLHGTLPFKNRGGAYLWQSTNLTPTQTPARAQACIRIIINLALRLDRFRADLKRLEIIAGLAEERKRLKEWQDRLLNQVITEPTKLEPPE
jgi:hypothetical protein